ncbi:MAG: hypothetical protein SFU85_00150 [Candidatus Methylacidiphilales bacterium]|nr:hypothetical protein [Candidatus Methylacidiphilales bacterium]
MSSSKPSLKQIAKRYAGNLSYFKENHYFRTLRKHLFLYSTLAALLLVLAATIITTWESSVSGKYLLSRIYNPGPVSQAHADLANDCAACHGRPNSIFQVSVENSPVDTACMKCHQQHDFHASQSPRTHSCTACHHEHLTAGPMKPVADANCASCHGNTQTMRAAETTARSLPPSALDLTPRDGHTHFQPGRSATPPAVFTSFEKGHPEWQIHREKLKDPNSLAFNHALHLKGDGIPLVGGKKLDCNYCHQPDPSGSYLQPMVFEKNCQACHSLQFDPRNPDLAIPHGSVEAVQAYLASLPLQYAKKGRARGISGEAELRAYVMAQIEALRQDVRSGDDLTKKVFFSDADKGPTGAIKGMPEEGRARFAGCAYCHQVGGQATNTPVVKAPTTPDRWLGRAFFNHAKHQHVSCSECHQAEASHLTSDILMPTMVSCQKCHSAQGGIVASCETCHSYHPHPTAPAAHAHFQKTASSAAPKTLKSLMTATEVR